MKTTYMGREGREFPVSTKNGRINFYRMPKK